ncbi:MAG: cytochrome-c oxidase, cbb3-type subunit III [Acidiferrobacterales bacterium]
MADFESSFWNWFISIGVIGGIIFCFWLIWWVARDNVEAGKEDTPTGHVWDEDLQELNHPMPKWWLNLFYITLFFGIGYLVLYPSLGTWAGVLGWTSIGQYEHEIKKADEKFGPLYAAWLQQDISALSQDTEAMKTATRLFINYCSMCHGSDAAGLPGGFPNLRDSDWLYGGKPQQIKQTILDGRAGTMPPWGAVLGEEGLFNVTEYVLGLSGRAVNEHAASQGKVTFQQLCSACHGANATGNYALGAPNLTDDVWLHGRSQKSVKRTIAEGRKGRMPPHREFLGEDKVHLLAAYVYRLSQER